MLKRAHGADAFVSTRAEAEHVRELAERLPLSREMALALKAYAMIIEASAVSGASGIAMPQVSTGCGAVEMQYRIYLTRSGRIMAAESFSAFSEMEAHETAALLYAACSDEFEACELWQGPNFLTRFNARAGYQPVSLDAAIHCRQQNLLDLEDALQRTFVCIQKSKRLLAASAAIRDRLDIS